ncbi:phytanoyl-CoA dioxygenase family protein [Nonomuraea sp. NPDC050547]|uniref:phytanoyl-CoA dioxygenase family protein n=1 Tax=unclassified Nonomuraea TaxID=2593643 RepID=UPI0037B0A66D
MRAMTDSAIYRAELDEHGWTVIPGVVDSDTVATTCRAAMKHRPSTTKNGSQWDGFASFPFDDDELTRLVLDARILRCVRALLGSDTPRLTRSSLWVKVGGHADYDQPLHADYPEHTLVVPRQNGAYREVKGYLYLTDVRADTGATRLISLTKTEALSRERQWFDSPEFAALSEQEVPAAGSAGSVLFMTPDVVHRGANITVAGAVRVTVSFTYAASSWPWIGSTPWARELHRRQKSELIPALSLTARSALGFPAPEDPYWTAGTIAAVARRYPDLDMRPYRESMERRCLKATP